MNNKFKSCFIYLIVLLGVFGLSPHQFKPILARTRIMLFALFLLIGVGMHAESSWAVEYYVNSENCSAENSGASWDDAVCDLNNFTGLTRGDTYYIADGNYGAYVFDDAVYGDKYIYVKKATIDEHGSDVGWLDIYGNGQAIFYAPLTFRTSYWVFDGQIGSGKTGYGFKVITETGNCGAKEYGMMLPPWASHVALTYITIQYTELEGCGATYDYGQTGIFSTADARSDHITIANNYIHNYGHAMTIRAWDSGCLIENNYMADGWSSIANHGEALSEGGGDGFTIRYNIVENFVGTGHFNFGKGTNYGYSDNIKIYGNIHINQDGQDDIGNGAYGVEEGELMRSFEIYNNTFINLKGSRTGIYAGTGTGNKLYNNLFFQCENPKNFDDNTISDLDLRTTIFSSCSGNIYLPGQAVIIKSEDPFIDWQNEDYKLVSSTDAGTILLSPFMTDMTGIIRGLDGNWDIGAYEYSTGGNDITPPSNPSGLSVR